MNEFRAFWNSSKVCWEILVEEAQGDRFVKVFRHANTAHKMLRDRGIKFVEASINVMNKRHMLLVADPEYWVNNEKDIVKWFVESNIRYNLAGMILEFDTQEDKMMFMLRWS